MRTNDGKVLRSTEVSDIVHELRQISNTPTKSDAEFMRESADRISAKLGQCVRSSSAEVFVADLLSVGLLIDDEEEDV